MNLKEKLQTLVDAGVGLEKTSTWLENEDEILSKTPWLTKDHVKVEHSDNHK